MVNTLRRLQTIVGEQLSIEPNLVKSTTNFVKDLGADSLDVIELVIRIEYEFAIDIEDQYASKITTVGDALKYIEEG